MWKLSKNQQWKKICHCFSNFSAYKNYSVTVGVMFQMMHTPISQASYFYREIKQNPWDNLLTRLKKRYFWLWPVLLETWHPCVLSTEPIFKFLSWDEILGKAHFLLIQFLIYSISYFNGWYALDSSKFDMLYYSKTKLPNAKMTKITKTKLKQDLVFSVKLQYTPSNRFWWGFFFFLLSSD